MGGAFGAKISRSNQIAAACAVAANKFGHPIRVILDLRTNMEMIGKRQPYNAKYQATVSSDGILKTLKTKITCDAGYSPNEISCDDAAVFVQNCYNADQWDVTPNHVLTNTAANTFTRAPGTTQVKKIFH